MPAAAASRSARRGHDRRVLAAHLGDRRPRVRPSWKRRPSARPTSAEPVKTTPSIAPSASARPVAAPPWTSPTTPSGSPAAANASPTSAPDSGVCSDGLSTTVLPATSAPAAMPVTSATGKLNGPITPNTPNGRSTLAFVSSGGELPERDREAVVALDLRAVGLDQVDRLLHLGDRLRAALAGLERHRGGQLHVALARSRRRPGAAPRSARRPPSGATRAAPRARARPPRRRARPAPRARGSRRASERLGSRRSNAAPSNDARAADDVRERLGGPAPRTASSAASNARVGLRRARAARVRQAGAHAEAPSSVTAAAVGTAWQAARWAEPAAAPSTGARPRSSPRQRSSIPSRSASPDATSGQRGWKRQPARDPRRVGRLAREDLRLHVRALGHHREQRARVRMARVAEQLLGRALLDDPAEVHDRDPVGDVPREPEVVGDDEDRHAGLAHELQHQREDLAAHRRVEARDRLVGDEQPRLEHHRAGDHDALALAAGDLVRVAREEALGRAQAGARERLGDQRLLVARRSSGSAAPRRPPRRSSGAR